LLANKKLLNILFYNLLIIEAYIVISQNLVQDLVGKYNVKKTKKSKKNTKRKLKEKKLQTQNNLALNLEKSILSCIKRRK